MISKRILTIGLALPLYGAESSLIFSIEPKVAGDKFVLNPISYERKVDSKKQTTQTTQWHLQFIGTLKIIELKLNWKLNSWKKSEIFLTYSMKEPLTLVLEEPDLKTPWTLREGLIQIPLTLSASTDKVLESLWPTGDMKSISAIVLQSSGIYLQGKLPPLFYPDPNQTQPVLLRIPQSKEEDTDRLDDLKEVPFWTLEAVKFKDTHTAVKQIEGFAQLLANFRLPEPKPKFKRRLQTFVDDVDWLPDAQSKIQIFQLIGNPTDTIKRKLIWLTSRPNTRVTLGGQGTAEASYKSKFLRGELTFSIPSSLREIKQDSTSIISRILPGWLTQTFAKKEAKPLATTTPVWSLDWVEWRSQYSTPDKTSGDFFLELSQTEPQPKVELDKTDVQALSLPVSQFTTDKDEARYRSWMCLAEGWLGVDASAREAKIDPKKAIQGSISGVLELTPLIQGLQEQEDEVSPKEQEDSPNSSGLMVQIQSLVYLPDDKDPPHVVLGLSELYQDEKTREWGFKKLRLQIGKPMVVLITPAVWYQKTDDNTVESSGEPSFIPTLMAKSTKTDTAIDPASLIKERFGQGVFISENVIQPHIENDQNLKTVRGSIAFHDDNFRLGLYQNDREDNNPKQDILIWQRPVNYPVVQSFPLSPTRDTSSFLDSNRGLIPYQFRKYGKISVEFPIQGLPLLTNGPNAIYPAIESDWKLITALLTSRYFLPTLPGVEINLNADSAWLLYRHSVPVLDEAYAEVQESESDRIADTGNVKGRDYTRVQGTEAFNIVSASKRALGWLPKTATNKDGEIEILFKEPDEQARLKQLQGRFPKLEFRLKGVEYDFSLTRDRFDPEGKIPKTSGGLTLPILFDINAPTSGLPEFTVKPQIPNKQQESDPDKQVFGILNEGQPLLGKLFQKRIVTNDAVGLVQEEAIGEINSYKPLSEPEQRCCTKSFKLLAEKSIGNLMTLEVKGIRLAKYSDLSITDDLYQQCWMLHDGKGSWPTLGGFPFYPLLLDELVETNGKYTIKVEGIWLPNTPEDQTLPNNASQRLKLTFIGNNKDWKTTIEGGIDWFLRSSDEDTDKPHLIQMQAKIDQSNTTLEKFEFKDLILSIVFPLGLLELKLDQENRKTTATISKRGELKIQFPTVGVGEFDSQYEINNLLAFNLGSITIVAGDRLPPLSFYEFRWLSQGLLTTDNSVVNFLKLPGLSSQTVKLTASVIQRRAFFENEFGLFWVDDPTGRIGPLTPDRPGYAKAALTRKLLTVKADKSEQSELLSGGKWITGYLIQNGTTDAFLKDNPTNDLKLSPRAFFPFSAANPDRQEHLLSQVIPQGIQLAWEDSSSGGDRDFDDLVISLTLPPSWELSYKSSQNPQWKLGIGKENDLPLIDLPLSLYPLGVKKFILATQPAFKGELTQKSLLLPTRDLESAIVALEVSENTSNFSSLIADIQLRLKDDNDKGDPKTHLTARILIDLLLTESVDNIQNAELTGQWVLNNSLSFKTLTSDCNHQVVFYFDRAKVSVTQIFSLLQGRGPGQAISIGTIAEHKITLKDQSYSWQWQTAQVLWLTTLGKVVYTFLGTVERVKSDKVLFQVGSYTIGSDSNTLKVLNNTLEILTKNLEYTIKLQGYSSKDGIGDENQVLSEQRADAVKQWLINKEIDPARLTAQGLGEISTGDANQNRRTDIIIYGVKRPEITLEQLPSLVIEAGAVFELSQGQGMPSTSTNTADLENSSLRLLVRSLPLDEMNEAKIKTDLGEPNEMPSLGYILRLPFISSFNSTIPIEFWPTITLAEQSGYPVSSDRRSRRLLESPKITTSSPLSSVDIFKRTEQAQWLDSEVIQDYLGIVESKPKLNLVFLDQEGQLTLRLPDTLGDFGPLLKLKPCEGKTLIPLKASTLIAYSGSMLEPSNRTVFDYPFEVANLDLKSPSTTKINLQLVSFIGGRLQQLSQDVLKSSSTSPEILKWGRQRLEAKRRYEAAIVWQNFDSAITLIPRPFDIVQQDPVDFPQATALSPEDPTDFPYGQEIDPRCRLPELVENSPLALQAEPNLSLVVFEATPLIQTKAKSVAATRFRLAATGVDSQKTPDKKSWAGKLRPAQIMPSDVTQLFGCSKWDQVNFEQVTNQQYPSIPPQTINQSFLPSSQQLQDISLDPPLFDKGSKTLIPPLVDVITWAARPGETTRSIWSLEKLTYQNGLPTQQLGTHPVSVSLRRPRAVAAPDESVRLNTLNSLILNQQFFYANLQLTQVLGTTPIPPDENSIYGVAVSKRNFYPSQLTPEQSANVPALFYYKYKEDTKIFDLELLELFAIADQKFKANVKQLDDGQKKQVTQTALLWSDSTNYLEWQPNKRAINLDRILVENLPNPSESPWAELFVTTEAVKDNVDELEEPNVLNVRRINFDSVLRSDLGEASLKEWLKNKYIKDHSNQTINLILVQYQVKNPDKPESEWEWDKGTVLWSVSLAFLDQKGSIIAPEMGIALLTVPNSKAVDQIKNNTVLSGYGRLDDDNFSPLHPFATNKSTSIEWIRIAGLKTLERIDTTNLGSPPYDYDVIVYGSGGELIPIEDK